MISGDESNLDGLWHRFSYVGLPETSIEPFTELTGDLTDELDKIYTALSEQARQTYCLSLEAKPLWAEWHYEMQSKRMSATQEMLKGVYPKFAGICGRNALILHCTYAASAAGILTQEEYDTKKSAIEKQSNFAGKLKQLENAKDAGIITHEEFEQKKLVLIG